MVAASAPAAAHMQSAQMPLTVSDHAAYRPGQVHTTAPGAANPSPPGPLPATVPTAGLTEHVEPQVMKPSAPAAAGPHRPSQSFQAPSVMPSNMHQALVKQPQQQPPHAVHSEAGWPADIVSDMMRVVRPPSGTTWMQTCAAGDMAMSGQGNLLQPSAPDYLLHAPQPPLPKDSSSLLPPALAHHDPHTGRWVPTLLPINPFRIAQLAQYSPFTDDTHLRRSADRYEVYTPSDNNPRVSRKHPLNTAPQGAGAAKRMRSASESAPSVPWLMEQPTAQLGSHGQEPHQMQAAPGVARDQTSHEGPVHQDSRMQQPWAMLEPARGSWQQPQGPWQQPQDSWQQHMPDPRMLPPQYPAADMQHQQPSINNVPRPYQTHGLDHHPGLAAWQQHHGTAHNMHLGGGPWQCEPQHGSGTGLHQQHTDDWQQQADGQLGQYKTGQHASSSRQHANGWQQEADGQLGRQANWQHAISNGQHLAADGHHANGWQQTGNRQLGHLGQHHIDSTARAMPQERKDGKGRLHEEIMHFSTLASPTEVQFHCCSRNKRKMNAEKLSAHVCTSRCIVLRMAHSEVLADLLL